MIIKIRNFGAIKSCDIDLEKDLIAIFGENDIGKSYAISAVYLLLKNIFKDLFYPAASINVYDIFLNPIDILANNVAQKKGKVIDITKEVEDMVKNYLEKTLILNILQSFITTFGEIDTIKNNFSTQKAYIELETRELIFNISLDKNTIKINNLNFKKKIIVKFSKVNKKMVDNKQEKQIYFCEKNQDNFTSSIALIIRYYTTIHDQQDYFIESYYLPASRSGLYQGLSVFGQIFAQLAKSRNLLKQTVEIPSISEPVSDYFITLSGIEIKDKAKKDNPIFKITNRIEKNILNGKILFDEKTKKILYRPDNTNLTLDVSLTSSMVSEISPIVSFLQYIVAPNLQIKNERFLFSKNKKILLFIEEPEAHLHPKIQMELMEIFVELVNVGVKIVFTSHSDYMFNKMNNLILEKKLAVEKANVIVFHKTEEGGVAKAVSIDELGADDENFIEAAEALYNEKMDLIDKLNNENN